VSSLRIIHGIGQLAPSQHDNSTFLYLFEKRWKVSALGILHGCTFSFFHMDVFSSLPKVLIKLEWRLMHSCVCVLLLNYRQCIPLDCKRTETPCGSTILLGCSLNLLYNSGSPVVSY